jgi:hypothetical protein
MVSLLACRGPAGPAGEAWTELPASASWRGETVVRGVVEVPVGGVLQVAGLVRFEPGGLLVVRGALEAPGASFVADLPADLGQELLLAGDADLAGARFADVPVTVTGDGVTDLDGATFVDASLALLSRGEPLAVEGATFEGATGGPAPAISVEDAADVTFSALRITGWHRAVEGFAPAGGARLRLLGGELDGGDHPLSLDGPFTVELDDLRVTGTRVGLELGPASGSLHQVTVQDVVTTGITGFAPGSLTLSAVVVSRAGGDGVRLGSTAAIDDLVVRRVGGVGLAVADDAVLARLDVTDTGSTCVSAGDRATVTNATLSDCGAGGLSVGDDATVRSLDLRRATSGVSAGQALELDDAVVDVSGGPGPVVAMGSGRVAGATLSGGRSHGVSSSGDVVVDDVSVRDVGGIGLYAVGELRATDAAVELAGGHGLLGDRVTAVRVVVAGAGDAGVYSRSVTELSCLELKDTDSWGVYSGGPASLVDVSTARTGIEGVRLDGGGALDHVSSSGAGSHGLYFVGAEPVVVTAVDVRGSARIGILGGGLATTVSGSDVANTLGYAVQSTGEISDSWLRGCNGEPLGAAQTALGTAGDGALVTGDQVYAVDAVTSPRTETVVGVGARLDTCQLP